MNKRQNVTKSETRCSTFDVNRIRIGYIAVPVVEARTTNERALMDS